MAKNKNGRLAQARKLLEDIATLGEEMEKKFDAIYDLYPATSAKDFLVALQGSRRRLCGLLKSQVETQNLIEN